MGPIAKITSRVPQASQNRLKEILSFCLAGGFAYLVDIVTFNAILLLSEGHIHPVVCKIISVALATIASWTINRNFTFSPRANNSLPREVIYYALINILGMTPGLLCLWISHDLLGWDSLLADNISGNVVGLFLGMILRYFCYRHIVFTPKTN